MSGDPSPIVSVIMGTRYIKKDVTLLRRSVSSILNQTFTRFELLICDDGSSSEAVAFLESIGDTRVKLLRDSSRFDLAYKLNFCLMHSRGEFVARMDDDDWSYPDRLDKEIGFLMSNPNVDFVGSNVMLVQGNATVGERRLPEYPLVKDFFFTQPFVHPTLVFRKDALMAVGGYSESLDCVLCEDYDLLLRLYETGSVGANLQEVLLDYTIPLDPKGNRSMRHRFNEVKTRYRRFKSLGVLHKAFPYVIKPIAVGLIPDEILAKAKRKRVELYNGDREKVGK